MPQVPPPPQADGRNNFCSESVDNKVEPGDTTSSFSSLMVILTVPDAVSFDLAYSSIPTRSRMIPRKTTILSKIIGPRLINQAFSD
jgi:hypothetical protein